MHQKKHYFFQEKKTKHKITNLPTLLYLDINIIFQYLNTK